MYQFTLDAERVAANYSALDMLLIAVCCRLETLYGMRRKAVAEYAPQIAEAINRPRGVSKSSRLLLSFDPIAVEYREDSIEIVNDAVVIGLGPVLAAVSDHLMPMHSPKQYELNLNSVGLAENGNLVVGGNEKIIEED
ncbi:hypothetical protein [Herbaspirillum frisingense]|uniref:hypothetical protein n=1 Tax=Herbaspirillum frisingense TaxID=92645 RepID=UPI0039AFE70A